MTPTSFGARNRWQGGLLGVLAVAAALFAAPVQAQETGRITGSVTDAETGAPVADVQVYLADQNIGAISRQNGAYVMLNVPAGTYEIRAERIGLSVVSRQITVGAGAQLTENFEMAAQALGLDEIVVTGTAGASRRREVGNSISQINTVDLPDRPTSVSDMIQAMAPGVQISPYGGGGEIGQGAEIRIRGINSINNNTSPIIFIDGIRIMSENFAITGTADSGTSNGARVRPSPLDQLNPNDIERIEVISGPAASTLYGTEAAAGVIQVFTRRGSSQAPVWTAETQQGTMWLRPFGMNGENYLFLDPWICSSPFQCGEYMDVPIQQYYSTSVRGGAQALQYFVSSGHERQEGSTPNDNLTRWNIRGNFTLAPMDDVVLQWNTSYTNTWQNNTPSSNNVGSLALSAFRGDQSYFGSDDPAIINEIMDWEVSQTIERFTTGGTLTYAPIANLTNRVTVGYDFSQQEGKNVRPFGWRLFPQGGIDINVFTRRYLSFDYVGSYTFSLLQNLGSTFSWGGQATGDFSSRVRAFGEGFPGAAFPTVNSSSSTLGFEDREKVWNSGFFFQNVFDVSDRYFVTLGLRVDGNSTFGSGFGLQMYPKVSGSWVVSDESFWQPRFGEMKLRAAWGKSGRAPDALIAQRTWNNTGLAGAPAFTPQNLGNPDIGPEVTSEIELGFDASWFSDRVRPRYTYYHQTTKDAIQNLSSIPSLGFTSSVSFNVGEVQNWGHELALDVTALQTRDWGLDIGANVSTNRNEVIKYLGSTNPATQNRVGRPIDYDTWDLYHNPNGMGTGYHSGSRTYSTQDCLLEDDDDDLIIDEDGSYRWRPGIDPTIHACDYPSETIYGYAHEDPTLLAGGMVTLRLPQGITVSARGDVEGGHGYWRSTNAMGSAIGRNVIAPLCYPYYVNPEVDNLLKPDTPAIWVRRCRQGSGYDHKGDLFQLRTLSATVPMDFAFPDRVQSATLTVVLGNFFEINRGSLYGNYRSSGERVPEATTVRAALRVTF